MCYPASTAPKNPSSRICCPTSGASPTRRKINRGGDYFWTCLSGGILSFEDFTVGVTSNKRQAQFIVSESRYSDYTVRAGEDVSYPDLSIKAGADVSYPDITIEIRSSGIVDYVVYTEKDFITLRDIVIALLPAINTETGFKFDELKEVFKE